MAAKGMKTRRNLIVIGKKLHEKHTVMLFAGAAITQAVWLKPQKLVSSHFWRLEVKEQDVHRIGLF